MFQLFFPGALGLIFEAEQWRATNYQRKSGLLHPPGVVPGVPFVSDGLPSPDARSYLSILEIRRRISDFRPAAFASRNPFRGSRQSLTVFPEPFRDSPPCVLAF